MDVAHQLAAHPRWRWMAGMLVITSSHDRVRIMGDRESPSWLWDDGTLHAEDMHADLHSEALDAVPDLADSATVGCLIAMLREAADEVDVLGAGQGATEVFVGDWRSGPGAPGEALARAVLEAWGEA